MIRGHDWSATPLGPIEAWPASLRTLVDLIVHSPQAMTVLWGPDLIQVYNDRYAAICGPRHPRALGQANRDTWPEVQDFVGPVYQRVLRGETCSFSRQPVVVERHGVPAQGWFDLIYSPAYGDGRIQGVVATVVEVTERTQAEESLRRSDQRIALALDAGAAAASVEVLPEWRARADISSIAGLHHFSTYGSYLDDLLRGHVVAIADVATDPRTAASAAALHALGITALLNVPLLRDDGLAAVSIAAVNPAWTATLGWPESDLAGRNLFDLIHPDDLAPSLAGAASLDTTGRLAPNFENRYRHRDGSYRWFSWTANKSDNMIVAVGRDITEERARASALLEAEEKLRHSQKMEAVGQLTGGLAHDFNNLLGSISGSLELLALRVRSGELRDLDRFIGIAQGAVRRAGALTHRLLAFSRRQPLNAGVTDVERLVADLLDMLRRTMGPAIALEVARAQGAWPILFDPNQLENALLNLCINARDAMPDGGLLRIGMANVAFGAEQAAVHDLAEGDYVMLSVTDSGSGMSPETAAKAFDPFFTTKPIGQGTGLGLSMIYGLARQSGGHVWLDTAPGRGTTIHLVLPRHHGGAAPREAPAAQPAAPVQTGMRVLLVDDEAALRGLMSEALARRIGAMSAKRTAGAVEA
ncbi:nitrogen regulation protein NR(II) [Massilia sp. 9096]|uniref:two-component system sensor histidine kinase NtrB n=1 Tax=Massilia sp. 9096 TaxID=1500894 RepID=UPI00068EA1B9|nr:ATP-binding protein [Massilia sp. 9096]